MVNGWQAMDSAATTQPVSDCPAENRGLGAIRDRCQLFRCLQGGQYARSPASTMFVAEDEDWDL